jgi:hypothetical protein
MADTELTVQTDGRHWSDGTDWCQTLNWRYRLMADTELTVQTDGRHWTDGTDWWQTLNWRYRLMADTELAVQTDGRHWTDGTDWWQTLNWRYRLMADTELTVQTDGRYWTDSTVQPDSRHWTVCFSFDSHYTYNYFLISYFYRIPFGFIFPLSVVWCCIINFLSEVVITRVILCVVFNLCMCTVLSGPQHYFLPRKKVVMNEIQYAEFVWVLLNEQVMLDTEFFICW